MPSIYIGFDPRETSAFAVCRQSINKQLTHHIPVNGIVLEEMRESGLYWRQTEMRGNVMWDVISDAPMSTEFAISRFLTPHLARTGWALFMDCDMMARTNFNRVFDVADDKFAVMCVKHKYNPAESTKMDGQVQTQYARKNWSSFVLFNCDHPSNKKLTVDLINTVPGRDLHRFCWLEDNEIGELESGWNWLVGEQPEPFPVRNIHWTQGGPWFNGYNDVPYADVWRKELHYWAA